MNRLLLDYTGDAILPEGYRLLETETDFLQHALTSEKTIVRGHALCEWAAAFWDGRRIRYERAISPCLALQAACPTLSADQADQIYHQLGQAKFLTISPPITALKLLQAHYPQPLWAETASPKHAASWLLWLNEQKLEENWSPVLEQMCRHWQTESPAHLIPAYTTDHSQAEQLLETWLGISLFTQPLPWGQFPIEVPKQWQERAQTSWHKALIQSQGTAVTQIFQRDLPHTLQKLAAQTAFDYFKQNPNHLTHDGLRLLRPYLSPSDQASLSQFLPPPPPHLLSLDSHPTAVWHWFHQSYFPYRQWQSRYGTHPDQKTVQEAAIYFAKWYLEKYPQSLVGGEISKWLSFQQSAQLATSSGITLLIVLDGLHWEDAAYLQQQIEEKAGRLTLTENGSAFVPLPTVTKFCKEALLKGVPPYLTEQVTAIGKILSETKDPLKSLQNSKPDALYIWRILEPDRTYHLQNSSEMLRLDVESELIGVATKIADIVTQLPADRPLKIVITSDHGRLLGRSLGNVPVPAGTESHGRAAWGQLSQPFPQSGYLIQDNLVYLQRDRFGLPTDAVLVLDDRAFQNNNGVTFYQWYPHGGVYPEEVIVPWLVFARDITPPKLEIHLSGKGQSGRAGTLTIQFMNLDSLDLTLSSLELVWKDKNRVIEIDQWLFPAGREIFQTVKIDSWLSEEACQKSAGIATIQYPNGNQFQIKIPPNHIQLQVEEMYKRPENILADLDL